MYQSVTNSMHSLKIQLVVCFDGNETHVLVCHCLGNRFRIIKIILVGLDEWLHEPSRDRANLMALGADLGCEEVRARTSFHADDRPRQIRCVGEQLRTRELLANDYFGVAIKSYQVEVVLPRSIPIDAIRALSIR